MAVGELVACPTHERLRQGILLRPAGSDAVPFDLSRPVTSAESRYFLPRFVIEDACSRRTRKSAGGRQPRYRASPRRDALGSVLVLERIQPRERRGAEFSLAFVEAS
jgi:hypothetical protein